MLQCIFWDVEHGSATTVVTPNKKYLAIDLGTGSYENSDATFSPLLHLKNHYNVNQLHTVIISHPHRDHIDDIGNFDALCPLVLTRPKHLNEDDIRKSNRTSDKEKVDKYLEIHNRYTHPVPETNDYRIPTNMGGVSIKTFTPTKAATSNINNHSVVTVLSYLGLKVLIPGDNEPVAWKELLEQSAFVDAIEGTDILVAPHHGRDSGFCNELFDKITPRLVIISDGRFCDTSATNRYCQKATGWDVHKRSGGTETRYCVTTRKDGVIVVNLGNNGTNNFIEVTID